MLQDRCLLIMSEFALVKRLRIISFVGATTVLLFAAATADFIATFSDREGSRSPSSVTSSSGSTNVLSPHERFGQYADIPSSPPLLRMYMSAALPIAGSHHGIGADIAPPPFPLPAPPSERDDSNGASSPESQTSVWRWCYICSGKFPDRECELYPKRVTRGPAKTNCTKGYCTSYVRYKPKAHLIVEDESKKPVAIRQLAPDDFDVTSIARECESIGRGNTCIVDGDQLGITCYSTCSTDFCNDDTRRPDWEHFRRPRLPEDKRLQQHESVDEDARRPADGEPSSNENWGGDNSEAETVGRSRGETGAGAPREIEVKFQSEDGPDSGPQLQQPQHMQQQRLREQDRADVVARSLPDNSETAQGPSGFDRRVSPNQNQPDWMPEFAKNLPPTHLDESGKAGSSFDRAGSLPNGLNGYHGDNAFDANRTSAASKNADSAKASEAAKSKSSKSQSTSSAISVVSNTNPFNTFAFLCVTLMGIRYG